MRVSEFSFVSNAEQLTLMAYKAPQPVFTAEIIGRIVAAIFISLSAVFDLVLHSIMTLGTLFYSFGASIYYNRPEFSLPWEHLERVRNAVAPLLFGSAFGLLHPYAGIALSEPRDKHAVVGMLSSNTSQTFDTPCSPVDSMGIIKSIAKRHRTVEAAGEKREVFSSQHIRAIESAQSFERTLEHMQGQEFVHKITNLTLLAMGSITFAIKNSALNETAKAIFLRLAGLLIPLLTVIDMSLAFILQTFFLLTGFVWLITAGKGPIYTEVTGNPLMHLAFLAQNLLKGMSNLIGTPVWIAEPLTGFKVSFFATHHFFNMQMNILMNRIEAEMRSAEEGVCFAIPILFPHEGNCAVLALPYKSMHQTYLIVEKKADAFNLYWVDRNNGHVRCKNALDRQTSLRQIRSMLETRFPFMDPQKMWNYPVRGDKPEFEGYHGYVPLAPQGNKSICVVSNLFAMLETLDKIQGQEDDTANLRYRVTREALSHEYDFYKNDVFPFGEKEENFSLRWPWERFQRYPEAVI